MKRYVIGIDVGTTCTKVILVDENGKVAGQGSSGYCLVSSGDRVEQNAQDWIDAVIASIRQAIQGVSANEVCGISCSTQGGSTVAVRADGSFIGNAWTWMDRRSTEQAKHIGDQLGNDYIYHSTGSRIGPALDAAKITNMRSNDTYRDAVSYYTTLEVVNRWLTGCPVIDPSNAAMRQLFSIQTGDWDDRILDAVGITRANLPEIQPAGALIGHLNETAASATGLPAGIPVYNGAHDQYCASLGAGAIHAGDLLLSAGTTWVLMGITDTPLYTESFIVPGRHPIPGLYGAIASLVGSGASMQWFHDRFMSVDFGVMNETVVNRVGSTAELFFFPYLNGAPYPIHNRNAKGVFAGLTLEHDQFDLARAIMEGVAFGVRRGVLDFAKNGAAIQSITMMGGASKSNVWLQMIASVTGVAIKQLNCSDACAMGAAMIAGCGCGLFKDFQQAAQAMVSVEHVYTPIPEEMEYYRAKFNKFDQLWSHFSQFYEGEIS